MPNTKQAAKRLRQDDAKRIANRAKSTRMKTEIKRVETAVEAGDAAEAARCLPEAYRRIDKAAKRNIIHANTAGRKKARLARLVKKAEG